MACDKWICVCSVSDTAVCLVRLIICFLFTKHVPCDQGWLKTRFHLVFLFVRLLASFICHVHFHSPSFLFNLSTGFRSLCYLCHSMVSFWFCSVFIRWKYLHVNDIGSFLNFSGSKLISHKYTAFRWIYFMENTILNRLLCHRLLL